MGDINSEAVQQIEKAANEPLKTDDFLAGGGLFPPEVADRFIDYLMDQSTILGDGQVKRFGKNEKYKWTEIHVGKRIALAHDEATDPGRRRKAYTKTRETGYGDFTVPYELSELLERRNLEGQDFEDKLFELVGTQLRNELEELALTGNTIGHVRPPGDLEFNEMPANDVVLDRYLGISDGWIGRLEKLGTNIVDADNEQINPQVFNAMLAALPSKYARSIPAMTVNMPYALHWDYLKQMGDRLTAAGDQAILTGKTSFYGTNTRVVPLWETRPLTTMHLTLSGTTEYSLGGYKEVSDVKVVPAASVATDSASVTPYVEGTDWQLNANKAKISRIGAGAIADGEEVKVTFRTLPQILFVHPQNLITAICRDIILLQDLEIYGNVKQFALHGSIGFDVVNPEACVRVINIKDPMAA